MYKDISHYIRRDTSESIGYGLFSHSLIRMGQLVGRYRGVTVSHEEFDRRRKAGQGGYGIYMSLTEVKDCKQAFLEGYCLVSAVNSYLHLRNIITGDETTFKKSVNAKIIVHEGSTYLRATRNIVPHEEILTFYS